MNACVRCGEPGKYEASGTSWCGTHVAGAQLIEEGWRFGFHPFPYPASTGHRFDGSPEAVPEGHVPGGKSGYVLFACQERPAAVWAAMYEVHLYNTGMKALPIKEVVHVVQHPCARLPGGCMHDAAVAVNFHPGHRYSDGTLCGYTQGARDRFGRAWCPRCVQAIDLLAEARKHQYPVICVHIAKAPIGPNYKEEVKLLDSVGAWKGVVTEMSLFEIAYYLALLQKRHYPTQGPLIV